MMIKNDTVVLQQQSIPSDSLVKPSMSRTLIHRTNKEFDKCAELLRNILTVQESRRNSKSSIIGDVNRKNQQQSQVVTLRPKKINTKSIKSPLNLNPTSELNDRRSLYSSTGASAEDQSFIKTRLSPTKSRKQPARSPNPKLRPKSPPSPSRRRRRTQDQQEVVRSSSCGDLPSKNFLRQQFASHLTKLRTISKQIRNNNTNDSDGHRLWNEFDSSLSSALAYVNDDIQYQLSLQPLRDEILQLRKQLQTTNDHLRQYDQRQMPKKIETNQIQYSQLLIHNQELKANCDVLQEKFDQLERNNIRLIQRWTQQDLRSLAERKGWVSADNRFLLREEILLLKQKLYHVYDDLATLFNRNHALEIQNGEQKQQLTFYKQQFNDLKQTAQHLLHDLDKRSTEDKVKRFLTNIILDQQTSLVNLTNNVHQSHMTPINVNSSSFLLETPHKSQNPLVHPTKTHRTRTSPVLVTNKLRPKSLFVTPTVLNDANALSKLQANQSPTYDLTLHTPSSSSTIYDAESILTTSSSSSSVSSSFSHQPNKRMTLYNSLPTLQTIDSNLAQRNQQFFENFNNNNNESGPELDQISDLTSKMFSSGEEEEEEEEEEEDVGLGVSGTSTSSSSSTIPTDAERLMQM